MTNFFKWFVICLLAGLLVACHFGSRKKTLLVGILSSPEVKVMEVAKTAAKEKYGLNVKFILMSSDDAISTALCRGEIQAGILQSEPYLTQFIKNNPSCHLFDAGKTFLYPMGIYSSYLKILYRIPDGGVIAIPDDSINISRALLLLEQAGLITLDQTAADYPTVFDIVMNPKRLIIKQLDLADLPKSLSDFDAVVMNISYAIANHLDSKLLLYTEKKSSNYAHIVIVQEKDKNDLNLENFISALQSQPVLGKARQLFGDAVAPAW